MNTSQQTNGESALVARKSWEEPCIVLERLLLVSAQDDGKSGSSFIPDNPIGVNPGGPGFMGPLSASGTKPSCR